MGVVLSACGGGQPTATQHNGPPPSSTVTKPPLTTTSAVPSSVVTCSAEQLAAEFRGSQGSAGNWFSTFWIANTAATPCAVRSGVAVVLTNGEGETRTATAAIGSPILLSPKGIIPPLGQDPTGGQSLANLTLGWPTVPNAVSQLTGGGGTQCPQPLFEAESALITFTGAQPLTVNQLTTSTGSVPSICGSDVRVSEIASLTAPSLP